MLHVLTIGLAAFLIFLIQPMISKAILPQFGGGASVWITSLIFFQTLLMAGYASSHLIARKISLRKQAIVFGIILAAALVFIPVRIHLVPEGIPPASAILLLLLFSIGLPYFLLSTTTPIIQYWIAVNPERPNPNPYILYAVSNAGSIGGLLVYPFFIEPALPIGSQFLLWSILFFICLLLLSGCIVVHLKALRGLKGQKEPTIKKDIGNQSISFHAKMRWLVQAMIPSAALMVFTHYITVDIVNMPLLWIVPLCLYLISFVLCFLFPYLSKPRPIRTVLVLLPLVLMSGIVWGSINIGYGAKFAVSLASLFAICMYFHGNLEYEKPIAKDLTFFYLYLSAGGSIGGILIGIIAPKIFSSAFEFHIVLAVSFYYVVVPYLQQTRKILRIGFQGALILLVIITFIGQELILLWPYTYKERSFYGVYSVKEYGEKDLPPDIAKRIRSLRLLSMGTTIHGGQAHARTGEIIPIAYYHEKTGVGSVLQNLSEDIKRIGIVGLGTGILSLYGKAGQVIDYFEIDPTVVDIAKEQFDVLQQSRAKINIFVGDARISLRKQPRHIYDVVILDAFTSGSIPTHLLTVEAIAEFLDLLKDDGIILYHISNHYVDLMPVLMCSADRLGLNLASFENPPYMPLILMSARWALLTRDKEVFEMIYNKGSGWSVPAYRDREAICWTDDFSNLWSVLRFRNGSGF